MFSLKLNEVDTNRPPVGRILTRPEAVGLSELLDRVCGVETTINERRAADMLRGMLKDALADT